MTVLITGSNKGLGRALALQFAKNKYNVIIHGRNEADLTNVQKEVAANGVTCDIVVGDITSIETIKALHKIAEEKDVSILINNAGVMIKSLVENCKDEDIDEMLSVNLASLMKLTKRVYAHFVNKKKGMIINVVSTAGVRPSELNAGYCASKYGVKGFTDCLRIGAKKNNVRVLGVYPAGMKTTFHERSGGHKHLDLTMKTEEVAQIIFSLVGYDSVHVDEIHLERMWR